MKPSTQDHEIRSLLSFSMTQELLVHVCVWVTSGINGWAAVDPLWQTLQQPAASRENNRVEPVIFPQQLDSFVLILQESTEPSERSSVLPCFFNADTFVQLRRGFVSQCHWRLHTHFMPATLSLRRLCPSFRVNICVSLTWGKLGEWKHHFMGSWRSVYLEFWGHNWATDRELYRWDNDSIDGSWFAGKRLAINFISQTIFWWK